MDDPFDVICIQDPPPLIAAKSLGIYNVWSKTEREVTEQDRPYMKKYGYRVRKSGSMGKFTTAPDPPTILGVAFLVRRDMPIETWSVETYDNDNSTLVASLRLQTVSGHTIHFYNVYNRRCDVNTDQLNETCMEAGADILLGDFNLHHPLRCRDNMRSSPDSMLDVYMVLHQNVKWNFRRNLVRVCPNVQPSQIKAIILLI